ncbi:hypothetical protein HYY69_05345 [Candidatus Woesearchaeota archaeon]|nr:hypothetical protein [Candidatus Woesearchaeota archaeon]
MIDGKNGSVPNLGLRLGFGAVIIPLVDKKEKIPIGIPFFLDYLFLR